MRSVTVSVSKEYNVLIGGGLLSRAGAITREVCGGEKAALVADDIVNGLYSGAVENSLRESGYATVKFVFPHGEQSKSPETYISLLNALTEAGLSRSDPVVALGGGVAGDLAGFAAATYLRGVPFVQIPTTVLAMVDSSIGGKTAINLPAGKNQAGAFYQPDAVICDYGTLKTLPEEIFRDGCSEIIKHAVILSAELFELLKMPLEPQMEDIITWNIMIKRDTVAADERDTGIRQILNFGHTIGHGVEKHSGYSITHGSAVAIGMSVVSRGAFRMGVCGEDCHQEIVGALKRFELPYETDILPDKLIEAAFSDKKRSGKRINMILPEKIGKCVIKSFSLDEAADFIRLAMS